MSPLSTAQKHDSIPIKTDGIIQDVAKFFNLGTIVSTRKITKGLMNSSFFVATDGGREYVIRLLDVWNPAVLKNEHFIQECLFEADILTSYMLKSENGEYVYVNDQASATVTEAIYGIHAQSPIPLEICRQIGNAMSKFHVALEGKKLPSASSNTFLNPKIVSSRLESIIPGEYQDGARKLLAASFISDDEDIPRGIIHSDLHVDNMLINNKNQIAILDLQNVVVAPYIYDIGRSIADICSYSNYLDPEKVAGFIAGYEENRVLTYREKEFLGKSIGYGAIATGLWFYEYGDYAFANHFYDVSTMAQSIITPR